MPGVFTDSVQSGESSQGTEVAMVTPGNKDQRSQDTNTQGPRSRQTKEAILQGQNEQGPWSGL